MVNLDGRSMYVVATAERGIVGVGTQLRLVQKGARVVGKYSGGRIERGCLIGRLIGPALVFHYLQRERSGERHGGQSLCDIVEQPDGRVRIVEHFRWHTRPGAGTNVFDELPNAPS